MRGKDTFVLGLEAGVLALALGVGPFPATEQASNTPWWLAWLLAIIGAAALLIPRLIERRPDEPAPAATAVRSQAVPVEAAAPAPAAEAPAPPKPDNLTRVEGIGPKISGVLNAAGIFTFAQLADAGVSRLEEILSRHETLRLAKPDTWPEQARLAAAGDWDGLQTLQNSLKGGRRVD